MHDIFSHRDKLTQGIAASAAATLLAVGGGSAFGQDAPGATDPGADSVDQAVPVAATDEQPLDRAARQAFSRSHRPKLSFFVEGGGQFSSSSELDGTDAEVSVARLRAALGLSFRVSDDTDFILRIGNEFSFYDFDDGAGIVPGMPAVDDPFDSVRSTTITPILRSLPETGWQWTIGGRVTSAAEPGADFGDSIIAGGFGLASYDIAENLRLGAGINIVSRLEGGVFVFPLPVIQWDITEQWRLGSNERGAGLTYFIDDKWSAGVDVRFMRREYRLDDDNAIPGGSFTDTRIPVALSVTYSPSPKTIITGRIGSDVAGEMEFNDRNENEIASYDYSPTLMMGLDVRIAF